MANGRRRRGSPRSRSTSRVIATLIAVALVVAACTSPNDGQSEEEAQTDPEIAAAEALADAMASGDFSAAPLPDPERAVAQADAEEALEELADIEREVEVSWVSSPYEEGEGMAADAALRWVWHVPGAPEPWAYPISVHLYTEPDAQDPDGDVDDDPATSSWYATWSRDLLARELGDSGVFSVSYTDAERGPILDGAGETMVADRAVWRVGIDKTFIDSDQWTDDALELAEQLDFSNPQAYADRVAAYGPRAFVDAVVVAQDSDELDLEELREIDGVNVVPGQRIQGPTEDFARPVLGRVGEATAEIIEESDGEISQGDIIGLTGLQAQFEQTLRGIPGITISVAQGASEDGANNGEAGSDGSEGESTDSGDDQADADADADADDGAGEAGEGGSDTAEPVEVFSTDPIDGPALHTTLDTDMQLLAEEVLADVEPASALVAIRPSEGDVLAVASGPGSQGWSTATLGQYAPGSTFKMVTALAMLRAGMEPEDTVQCPETITVDGRTFSNNPGYPDEALGEITLTEAIAHSCNTAFLGQHQNLDPNDIASAAAALGLVGVGDQGYPLFMASVPQDVSGTSHAAGLIGQGQVLASPLGMATVAASLSAGHTVSPTLIRDLEDFLEAGEAQTPEDGATEDGATEDTATETDDDGDSSEDDEDGDAQGSDGDASAGAGSGGDESAAEDDDAGVPGDDGAGGDDAEGDESESESTEGDSTEDEAIEHDAPLTNEEAAVLRQTMRAVVVDGTTPMLQDVPGDPVVAKSGTAEHGTQGTEGDLRAWVIAIQGDLAVAAFVEDGEYGAATAGPLVAEFLEGLD